MDIDEIREARREAESQIMEVMRAFYSKTGLSIVGVEIERFEQFPISGSRSVCIVSSNVRAQVEPI